MEYWRIVNQREHNKQPSIDFDKLLDSFRKLNSSETNSQDEYPWNRLNRINDLNENLDGEISKEEILKCVKSLKNDKACADFIINEYIKSTCNQLLDIYVKLFNIIFKCGLIPESWILGTIKPFYKNKGNKYDPKNYRL